MNKGSTATGDQVTGPMAAVMAEAMPVGTAGGEPDRTADETGEAPSQFERLREFIAAQIGAVRRVNEEQQSAERLVELAEVELGALRRELEARRDAARK